jgi:hypothetical protein
VRLVGKGRWERSPEGAWKLLDFSVDRFEVLDASSLSEVLDTVRNIPDNGLTDNAKIYVDLMALRLGDEGMH